MRLTKSMIIYIIEVILFILLVIVIGARAFDGGR